MTVKDFIVLIVLGLVSLTLLPATHALTAVTSNAAGFHQSSERTPQAGGGVIAGVVVNARREPVARATVLAFSAATNIAKTQPPEIVPFSTRASGWASTDAEGRFHITGLAAGEYLIGTGPIPGLPAAGSSETPIYATTFYPSTIDHQAAARVSAVSSGGAPIQIELVQVEGARVSGSVVSPSGRPTGGMGIRLFHRFGGFGSESSVGVVGANGTFEIPRVPPGWYRLTVGTRPSELKDAGGEFADRLIEVQDRDLERLSLVLGPGASISGRVVADPGAGMSSAVGLRVSASPAADHYSASRSISATVASDWSFRMTGPSGVYQFTAGTDRPPFVAATRVAVDGREAPASAGIELADGDHEVVVFVTPRERPQPTVDKTLSSAALVEQFKNEKVFWRQSVTAKEIVARRDTSVLTSLAGWLSHEDRHVRGNVAFVFAGLGDPRGFQAITDILTDRSDRPEGQGIAIAPSDGRYRVARQIATDRYYAAHLLGDLRDEKAVPILVALLNDPEVNSIVPWALGEIGDRRAVGPLLNALDDDSPSMRVLAIYALETLKAKEALPRLTALLDDHRKSNFGAEVSVADAARAAIAKLQ